MIRRVSVWLPCAVLLASGAVALSADGGVSEGRILEEALVRGQAFDNLQHLTDAIGPRLTGSKNLEDAAAFAMEKFRSYGLSNVHREDYEIPSTWQRGRCDVSIMGSVPKSLTAASMGWTSPTGPGGVTGEVINIKNGTKERLAALGSAAKGKIGLIDFSEGGFEDFFKEFVFFPQNAETAGLMAVLVPSSKPDKLCDTGWGIGAKPIGFPFLSLAKEDSELVTRMMKRGPVKLHIELGDKIGPGTSVPYVVADLPGATTPEEFVLLGGHLDSWDLATGATDDGTGVMAVLEAARTLAALGFKPMRTIRFIMFSGEEEGFLGSLAYAKRHESETARIQAVFVMDTGAGRARGVNLQGRKDLEKKGADIVGPFLTALGLTENRADRAFVGCDNVPFTIRGVPAFTLELDPKDYGSIHHAVSDTIDKVKPEDLNFDAGVLAILAARAANASERLGQTLSKEETAKMLKEAKLDELLKAFGLIE